MLLSAGELHGVWQTWKGLRLKAMINQNLEGNACEWNASKKLLLPETYPHQKGVARGVSRWLLARQLGLAPGPPQLVAVGLATRPPQADSQRLAGLGPRQLLGRGV